MPKTPRDPFAVSLNNDQKKTLALWLTNELENAQAAKSSLDSEVDYWHMLYEQARTRRADGLPWPDAADLTSYIPCEKVDSIHARLMRTVWTNPVWTVEGWGQSADRAPFVEEFHQFKAEEERLQAVLDKWSLTALIEPRGLLEVYESSQRRTSRKTRNIKAQTTPEGGIAFDAQGMPQLERDQQGNFVDATPDDLGVQTVVDSQDYIRCGPQYRVLPYRDSLILPGHARDDDEIFGYFKRVWPKLRKLQAQAKDGVYDEDAVFRLGDDSDREQDDNPALHRAQMAVVPHDKMTAEKECWEGLILVDLNALLEEYHQPVVTGKGLNQGERWYLVTIHLKSQTLLRWVHDDDERSRYIPLILFPRPDRAGEGFSLIGHKLITTTEEHTAYRNMGADYTSMSVNRPILKLQGALWEEDEQPWGPKAVITVRTPQELTQMQVADEPVSIERGVDRAERTADRIAGVNDIASGQVVTGDKTLGEIQMATEQAFVRMDLIVRRFQEKMEDLAQIRHAIWKKALADEPDGIDAPESVIIGLEGRGVPIEEFMPNGKITAAMLDGSFRFKPYGSVETADVNRLRNDFVGALQGLAPLLQAFPLLRPMFGSPRAARAMGRQFLRVFRIPNEQAFLGSPAQDMAMTAQLNAMPPAPAIPPPPPMVPPGIGPQGSPMAGPPGGVPPMNQGPLPPPMMPGPGTLQ